MQNICTLCVHDGVPSPNVYFTRCNFSKILSGFLRSFRGVVYDDREKRSQAKKTGSPAGMSVAPPRLQMLDCAALRFVRPEALFQGVDYLFSTLVYKTFGSSAFLAFLLSHIFNAFHVKHFLRFLANDDQPFAKLKGVHMCCFRKCLV